MRATYLFIVLFLAWCVLCARWYVFSVKGLTTDPAHFNPHETTVAIVEVLFMVLVAFLLGFTIAWLLRETGYKQRQSIIQELQSEKSILQNRQHERKDQIRKYETDLARIRGNFLDTTRENEKLKTEVEENRKEAIELQDELTVLRSKVHQSDSDHSLLKYQIMQHGQLIEEKQETNERFQRELEEQRSYQKHVRKEPVFSDFINDQLLTGISEVEDDEIDDLKIIAGIGQGIEKKLNSIGIYSFRQISELTEDSIRHISTTIKFFSGRIQRDNWIEQATRLYLKKSTDNNLLFK
ncbi:MAG: hypothetical protein AABY93_05145 [Bacteroidota bacterium]